MKKEEFYRPKNIEFDVANDTNAPETFGIFNNEKEVLKFIGENLTAINQVVTVSRHMDSVEISEIRKDCQDILEVKLPMLDRDLIRVQSDYDTAKKTLSNAKELVSASTNEVIALGVEIQRGTKQIDLGEQYTWRVPFRGRFLYYTWIDKELKLCKIKEILESEKDELFSASATNEDFFTTSFPSSDE